MLRAKSEGQRGDFLGACLLHGGILEQVCGRNDRGHYEIKGEGLARKGDREAVSNAGSHSERFECCNVLSEGDFSQGGGSKG